MNELQLQARADELYNTFADYSLDFGVEDQISRLMTEVLALVADNGREWDDYRAYNPPHECGRLIAHGQSKRFKALLERFGFDELGFMALLDDRQVDQKWLYFNGITALYSNKANDERWIAEQQPGFAEGQHVRRFKLTAKGIHWPTMPAEVDGVLAHWFRGLLTLNEMPGELEAAGASPRDAERLTGQLGLYAMGQNDARNRLQAAKDASQRPSN